MTNESNTLQGQPLGKGQLVAVTILPWLLAIASIAGLIWACGIWNLVANTRLLDLLIEGGVVRYHDLQIGFIPGIPELKYFIASQDPIEWVLILLAVLLMLAYWGLKSLQFSTIASMMGSKLSRAQVVRAYLSGQGVERWMPFRQGDHAIALGMTEDKDEVVDGSVYMSRFFTFFEIVFFAIIGLFVLGWGVWVGQLFWPAVITGMAYLMIRRSGGWTADVDHETGLKQSWNWLMQRPLEAFGLALLSCLAFFAEHVAVYVMSQAFTSPNVIINIQFSVFLMAIVAGQFARLIPVTPGGIGQFEWGFALAIYFAGTGMPEAVTIALLFSVLRYTVGGLIRVVLNFSKGPTVGLREVLASMRIN